MPAGQPPSAGENFDAHTVAIDTMVMKGPPPDDPVVLLRQAPAQRGPAVPATERLTIAGPKVSGASLVQLHGNHVCPGSPRRQCERERLWTL